MRGTTRRIVTRMVMCIVSASLLTPALIALLCILVFLEAVCNYVKYSCRHGTPEDQIYMFKSIIFHIYFCTPHRVRWNLPECSKDTNSIEFDGVPFIVVGKLVLECHQGKEKTRKAKQAQQLNDDHGSYKKKRFLVQPSKKIGCPAQVIMREVIRFDQFKVSSNSIWRKEEASKLLRQCLSTVEDPTMDFQRRIYVTLPTVNEHKFHVTGERITRGHPQDELG